jgi:uncharacterized membrane protein YedE/YeeE
MICGVSRLSPRSLAATATFFVTGVLTARVLHGSALPPTGTLDWTLGPDGKTFLLLQLVPLAITTYIRCTVRVSLYFRSTESPLDLMAVAGPRTHFVLGTRLPT